MSFISIDRIPGMSLPNPVRSWPIILECLARDWRPGVTEINGTCGDGDLVRLGEYPVLAAAPDMDHGPTFGPGLFVMMPWRLDPFHLRRIGEQIARRRMSGPVIEPGPFLPIEMERHGVWVLYSCYSDGPFLGEDGQSATAHAGQAWELFSAAWERSAKEYDSATVVARSVP